MKINFDSLFEDENTNKNQKLLQTTFSFDPETKHQLSTYSILTQDTSSKPKKSLIKNADEVKELLQSKMQDILKNKASICEVKFAKKKKSVNLSELTQRIYQQTTCNKKYCKQLQLQKPKQQILEILQTKKQFRANQSFRKPKQQHGNVFDKLHNQSKLLKFRYCYQNDSIRESQNSTIGQSSKRYLKNYVPFYDRLQHIISKSQQKKNFIQSNPHLDFNQKQNYFTPVLYKNKEYKDVQPRYMKELSTSRQACSHKYEDSLNTSYQSISSLNKSMQLVNDIENYFYNRMECIFINQETGQVEINQKNINLLSSVEFKIMQDFIMELQSNSVEGNSFTEKLCNFYENLNFRDKQELRVHQSKLKKYSKQSKQQMRKKTQQKMFSKMQSKNSKNFEKDLLFV